MFQKTEFDHKLKRIEIKRDNNCEIEVSINPRENIKVHSTISYCCK